MRSVIATVIAALGVLAALQGPFAQQRRMQPTVGIAQPGRAQVLTSSDALPAHIGASFSDPAAFVESSSGDYLVLDRRAQAVYSIDRERTAATRIVEVGEERGRIIRPTAFAADRDGSFVVADQPGRATRLQRFAARGYLLNGFTLPAQPGPQYTVNGLAVGGVGSVQYTGDSIFVSLPHSGSLITEYSWDGRARRGFGALRRTGQESDADVHLLLNSGLPLVDPGGGFYFVFQAGTPAFRKYDAAGQLVFERHVEGPELDDTVRNQPSIWPRRRLPGGEEWPVAEAVVRAAAVDPRGNLWLALAAGVVYVYSPDGEKLRTVRMRAAGPLIPTSLWFSGPFRLLVTPGCYIFAVGDDASR